MNELKRCPFCGGEAKVFGYYLIQCTKCGSSTITYTNREEAIKAWNTRKPVESMIERLEGYTSHTGLMLKEEAIKIVKEEVQHD